MFDRIKTILKNLFSGEKFPDQSEDVDEEKTIGDVYDIQYMPSPDNPGEVVVVFAKKDET